MTAERRAQNLAMRLAGASWDRIADQLGYADKAAACKDFTRALQAARSKLDDQVTTLKVVELLRLDRLQAAFWTRALSGDHRAGKTVLEVHDRRVRLLKLDADQAKADNAVDAWLGHVAGELGGLDAEDAAALAAIAPLDDEDDEPELSGAGGG